MGLLRTALCGLLAGAAGTVAMDLVWFVRYKRGGGESSFPKWEFASGPDNWDDASAPAKVGKLLFEVATHQELPTSAVGVTTNVMHWGYGVQWGFVLATAIGNGSSLPIKRAPLLGALVWLASYVSLPIAGFYKPIWSYDLKTLWQDLSAHLVYGIAASLAFKVTCSS
jgi:uncharacterized membrane protein YagU involved in acid resistance